VEPFWTSIQDSSLRQGDYLPKCLVPVFNEITESSETIHEALTKEYDLIIVTQSCDLENKKVQLVATCPIYLLEKFKEANSHFKESRKDFKWENYLNQVLKGRIEGLHLLASPEAPADNQKALLVDFREIYGLPHTYLEKRAKDIEDIGTRWRLKSPFLEHFSQAFARFFMRVGLPSSIPPFRNSG
jgi:hypothetical protein